MQKPEVSRTEREYLEALLLGPPFDEQVLVEKTSCLWPNSCISSKNRLHAASIPHLDDVRTGCVTKAGLSCRGNKSE